MMDFLKDLIVDGPIRARLRYSFPRKDEGRGLLGQITFGSVLPADIVKVAQTEWARHAAHGWVDRIALTLNLRPEQRSELEYAFRVTYAAGMLGVHDQAVIDSAKNLLMSHELRIPSTALPTESTLPTATRTTTRGRRKEKLPAVPITGAPSGEALGTIQAPAATPQQAAAQAGERKLTKTEAALQRAIEREQQKLAKYKPPATVSEEERKRMFPEGS